MDLTTVPTTATDRENEAPPPPPPPPIAQPNKPFSLSNGALRKHSNRHPPPPPPSAVVLSYRECLKNHAARLGGHAVDGCGEFMPSPAANTADPTSLTCAACGCHRNFHRREEDPTTSTTYFLDFRRYPPLPPPPAIQSSPLSSSPSPPPPYHSSVPHTLLGLSTAAAVPEDKPTRTNNRPETPTAAKRIGRKRFRTKFSREQKEKMRWFSEKVGWKIQRSDEGLVEDFCNEVGVGKGVLKVWMHNNKHTLAKRSETAAGDKAIDRNGRVLSFDNTCRHNNSPTITSNCHHRSEDNNGVHLSASSSGSPSSSS